MQWLLPTIALTVLATACGRFGYEAAALDQTDAGFDGARRDTDEVATRDASGDVGVAATCGDRLLTGEERCDDGNQAPGDGCGPDCQREICGDGAVDFGEDCDDGNASSGDGCENDCRFSCVAQRVCDNANACDGEEDCSSVSHACAAGVPASDGTACSAGTCQAGLCVPAGCGDRTVGGDEECDDGNEVTGDGCEPDCRFSCSIDADCALDSDICNGSETCSASHICFPVPGPADGTACDRDGDGDFSEVCRAGACTVPVCGDGFVEGEEQCDDDNEVNGDGCDNDCRFSCELSSECDDGVFCNGAEICDLGPHTCRAGASRDGSPCPGGVCSVDVCMPSDEELCDTSADCPLPGDIFCPTCPRGTCVRWDSICPPECS